MTLEVAGATLKVGIPGPPGDLFLLRHVPFRTLSTRIAVPAGFFTLASVALLSFLLIRSQREQVLTEVVHGSESVSEAVLLSVDHDMRLNRRDGLREMIETIGRHEGIHAIRLINKSGVISFSSHPQEVGDSVDPEAEGCVACHTGSGPPLVELTERNRTRIYRDARGRDLLSTIHVIRNEQGCQGARCHLSPRDQPVLGVLDVAMSLEPVQARLGVATRNAAFISLAAVVLITAALFLIIRHSVNHPITRMIGATRRVAESGPAVPVPPGTAREIGILATSFNEMMESLASSKERVEEWASTLEQKVADKAEQLREARFQVVRAEKLSSVGLVAAGIAHELNSPLMAIITFTHLVKSSLPEDDGAQEDLRMIEREANRCASIIRQLLDYSREQAQEPDTAPHAIGPILNGALDLLKVEIQNAGVDVRVTADPALPDVEVNDVQLMQVFVNLIMNAVQAMPEGGEILIRADVVPRHDYHRADLPPHPGDELLRVLVADTGSGILPKDLAKVFDPFFTTKPVGKGSGLGLSVSLGLVRGFRGTILVDSDGESWTEFTVLLPVRRTPIPHQDPLHEP